jgi:dUTP pyrophosphatase
MFQVVHKDGYVPHRATYGAAGFDLQSRVNVVIQPNESKVIDTGVAIDIPNGHYAMVCSRSGLAAKHNVFVLNAPGIIDSDYHDEVKIILMNLGTTPFVVERGHRIAQLVFAKSDLEILPPVSADTERKGGLGSTGV